MKNLILIFISFCFFGVVSTAIGQNTYQKAFGGPNNDVLIDFEQTIDGGLLILGYTESFGSGGYDIILTKLNSGGDILWSKLYGGGGNDYGHDLKRLNNGDYIISAQTTSSGAGSHDIYILRVDSNGNLLWSQTYGGNDWEQPRGKAIETANGDLIILSTTLSFGVGAKDIHFLRINANGEMLITKTFGGGWDNDWVHDYIQLGNNSILLSGRINHNESGSLGSLINIDEDGNLLWAKSYNESGFCKFYRLKKTEDGNIIAVGRIDSYGAGQADIYVVKTTPGGELIWAKTFGGPGYELANGLDLTSSQDIIISGYTESAGFGGKDIFLIKLSNSGEFLWGKNYGGDEDDYIFCGGDLLNFNNTAYYINGITNSYGFGNKDMYLIKTNTSGVSSCNEQDFNPSESNPSISANPIQIYSETGGIQGEPNTITIDFILPDSNLCVDGVPPIAYFYANDTIICQGDCIDFIDSSKYNPTSWSWYFEGGFPSFSTSQNPTNICYNSPGEYDVKLIVSNQYGIDSLIIENYISVLADPEINLGNDTLICEGDFLELSVEEGYSSYLWNNGSTETTIIVDTFGYYWVEVINEFGCTGIDSILVEIYPTASDELDLGSDTIFCPGEGFSLNAGAGYTSYQWQDGSTDSIFVADTAGVYWVYVENPCSFGSDTIFLEVFPETLIDLGNDTAVCFDESILLDSGFGFESYLWQDGSSNQFLYASLTGSYWVQVMDNNFCYAFDTIKLEFIFPDAHIGNDTSICSGDSVTFYAASEFVNYIWHNGSTNINYTTGSEGAIWCEVTDTMGCVGRDSAFIDILFPPEISLGNDTSFCQGDSLWLVVKPWNNENEIIWQNGSADSSMLILDEGFYWVMASNVCGSASDSVLVSVNKLPWVFIGNDTILATNTMIDLDAGYGFEDYFWCDGCETQSITISEGGSYWVNVFDGQCYNTDTIYIEPIACELFIPIVFTPNWDRSNDYFYAETSRDITDFQLTVFNRWGEVIWETNDKDAKWDGQKGSSKADEGTYFWVLQYKCLASPIQFEKKGSVTLLR